MRFRAEHVFDAAPAEVAALLVEPGFYETLALADVGPAEVLGHRAPGGGGEAHIVVRYEYTGGLDPLVRRLLGGARLTWTQELRLRPDPEPGGAHRAFAGTLEVHADANPRLLHGRADVALACDGAHATRRTVDGELVVSVPGLGGVAERRIVPGVVSRLDAEAHAAAARLRARG